MIWRVKLKTYSAKKEQIVHKWYLVDAENQILGRLASRVASILRGKHHPTFTPHLDMGDHVVIINADKVRITGKKLQQRFYYHHSGYPGGLKQISLGKLLREKPEQVLYHAIWGMLPKNRLGRKLMKKVRIYAGPSHPHQAQQPESLELK